MTKNIKNHVKSYVVLIGLLLNVVLPISLLGQNFSGQTFDYYADFRDTTFNSPALFVSTIFNSAADFSFATFTLRTNFNHANFKSTADFINANFDSIAYFFNTTFNSKANFFIAKFDYIALFNNAKFDSIADFSSAYFNSTAHFYSAKFNSWAFFSDVTFNKEVDFSNITLPDFLDFSNVTINTGEIDLTTAKIDPAKQIEINSGEREKPKIFLYGADVTKFKIDFNKIEIAFDKESDTDYNVVLSTFEGLLKKMQDEGYLASRESLDIQYRNFKYDRAAESGGLTGVANIIVQFFS